MEWVLLGLAACAYALLPLINLLRQNGANTRITSLTKKLRDAEARLEALAAQLQALQQQLKAQQAASAAQNAPAPLPPTLEALTPRPVPVPPPAPRWDPGQLVLPTAPALSPMPASVAPPAIVLPVPPAQATPVPAPQGEPARDLPPTPVALTADAAAAPAPEVTAPPPPTAPPRPAPVRPAPVAPPPKPAWLVAAQAWLFGGNLVAKVGLLILFIGLAFLLRLAAEYVVIPVEVWHAGVAALATALLWWGWRIRETRSAIGLPTQGAALGMLMLVTFSAYRLFDVIPAGGAFTLLFALVVFTCLLASLQNAMWLAIFGIVSGFAVPILTSRGGGSHIGLFSYYALLNAGILALALRQSWRPLNLLGFVFTFGIGTAWGVLRYTPENYLSTQLFLGLFLLYYVAIAVLYAWRQAPQLKSYVDGTLVFGTPLGAMSLQYGLVKDMPLGMALSALALGLLYAGLASVLWRRRQGTLRLLVESFVALALVFCTLCIPLAVDGRWTSAAWALEGAAITWMGLRQQRTLAWQFGLLVQVGSWIAFIAGTSGLDLASALVGNLWLGFLVLGLTAALVAVVLRRHADEVPPGLGLATGFISVAVVWLLAGAWVEVWLRTEGANRNTLLVLSALAVCALVLLLSRRLQWQFPVRLAQVVFTLAGVVFIAQAWDSLLPSEMQVLSSPLGALLFDGPLLGATLLCAGALWSALALNRAAAVENAGDVPAAAVPPVRSAALWWLVAAFWWFAFMLPSLAAALSWLTARPAGPEGVGLPSYYGPPLPVYGLAAVLSAAAWLQATLRWRLPNRAWMIQAFWPALTALGSGLFLWHSLVDAGWSGQGIAGALYLAGWWTWGAWRHQAGTHADYASLDETQRQRGQKLALAGLAVVWFAGLCKPLADGIQSTGWLLQWEVAYGLCVLGSAVLFALAARRKAWPRLGWLAAPAWLVQALVSLQVLQALYMSGWLPAPSTWLLAALAWLVSAWLLQPWLRRLPPAAPEVASGTLVFDFTGRSLALQIVHLLRVVAPWLALVGALSVGLSGWLAVDTAATPVLPAGDPDADTGLGLDGWVTAGLWADYLAAWAGAISLFGLLRLARLPDGTSRGWLLAPLQKQYRQVWVPLGALWGALLVLDWNLRQDGGMAPLPYLPLLNPLDLTTGLVAVLVFSLILPREDVRPEGLRSLLWRSRARWGGGLGFAWFNLVLLRTASQWLDIPYTAHDLYASQFVQAMLSLVWSLTALVGMWWASRRAGRKLWMSGAALLGLVVLKLFVVDLSNVGSVARIVSFIGVGGLMLAIGYLAPLPAAAAAAPSPSDDPGTSS